ncbi:MAG: A/G-specific adenine glycosylase [Promethearchaeota archaeon]
MKKEIKIDLDSEIVKLFQKNLIRWYQTFQRKLPWRKTTDPYAVLVSEIMLHQTTVKQVIPIYERFLEKFPTVEALAAAEVTMVKAITDTLGYKRRGEYLWTIARTVVEEYGGKIPDDIETLLKLPGIGRYTAGAIVSFAFRKPAPIVDTNVIRVFTRIFTLSQEGAPSVFEKIVWKIAESLIPQDQIYDFNQAIMDLGAMVCIPNHPRCGQCPLREICQYYKQLPNPPPRQRLIQEFMEESS